MKKSSLLFTSALTLVLLSSNHAHTLDKWFSLESETDAQEMTEVVQQQVEALEVSSKPAPNLNEGVYALNIMNSIISVNSSFISGTSETKKETEAQKLGQIAYSDMKKASCLAGLAYLQETNLNQNETFKEKFQGYTAQTIDLGYGNSCLITWNAAEKKVFVSYKGTSTVRDWLTNLWGNFAYSAQTDAIYHNGFYKAYLRHQDEVKDILAKVATQFGFDENIKKLAPHLVITGHSQGAAVAQVHTWEFFKNTGQKATYIGFCPPNALSAQDAMSFNQELKDHSLAFVHDWDIVSKVPFNLFGFARAAGYRMNLPLRKNGLPHMMQNLKYSINNLMHAGTLASNDAQVVRTFQEHKLDGWMHTLGAKVVNPAYKTFAKAKNAVFSLFSKGKAAPAA